MLEHGKVGAQQVIDHGVGEFIVGQAQAGFEGDRAVAEAHLEATGDEAIIVAGDVLRLCPKSIALAAISTQHYDASCLAYGGIPC